MGNDIFTEALNQILSLCTNMCKFGGYALLLKRITLVLYVVVTFKLLHFFRQFGWKVLESSELQLYPSLYLISL